MQRILQELTALHKAENAKVALRARQVNVLCVLADHSNDLVVQWRNGRALDLRSVGRWFKSYSGQAGCLSCCPTNSVKALKAASTFGLGRRRWSSPQKCYVHCLHTCPKKYCNMYEAAVYYKAA